MCGKKEMKIERERRKFREKKRNGKKME